MEKKESLVYRSAINGSKKMLTNGVTLVYFQQGQGEVFSFGKKYSAGYGNAFLLLDGEFMEISSRSAVITVVSFLQTELSSDTLKLALSIANRTVDLLDDGVSRLTDYFSALIELNRFGSDKAKIADKLFYCAISELKLGTVIDGVYTDNPLHKAIGFVNENFLTVKKLSSLAEVSGVTVNYLCSLFKSKTGISPNRYIKRLKIRQAEKLLLFSDLQVKEIAEDIGYMSFSHFMSDFKEVLSSTPNSYKKRYEN